MALSAQRKSLWVFHHVTTQVKSIALVMTQALRNLPGLDGWLRLTRSHSPGMRFSAIRACDTRETWGAICSTRSTLVCRPTWHFSVYA
jgi:hypothetical protein